MKSLRLLLLLTAIPISAQTTFPAHPLDRAQILVWMDSGYESDRVIQLIGRVGISFAPTDDDMRLFVAAGATQPLTDAITHAKQSPAPAPTISNAAFDQLAKCVKLTSDKKYEAAKNACTAATSDDPSITFFALGNTLKETGLTQEELASFRSAETADPSIPDTHNYVGIALQDAKDIKGATKEYEQAIQLDHDYDTPHNNIADILLEKKDWKRYWREPRLCASREVVPSCCRTR